MIKQLETLYKYTSNKKKVQQWTIFSEDGKYWTEEGHQGGKLTTSLPTFSKAKNVGKSNETTVQEQAELEAQAKWQKKVDSGYNTVLSDEEKFFKPMLAETLEDYEKLLFTVDTYISPKLDGLRAINQNNQLVSRNGKLFVSCPHLYQDDTIFDGELYTHLYKDDFNKIMSLCRKTKPTEEELEESKLKVEHWIYDYPAIQGVFSVRYKALEDKLSQLNNPYYKLVPVYQVHSMEDIERYHLEFLEQGYEGSMIRLDLGDYENKRSKQLLKKKNWMDDEFEILEALEGEGGRIGTIGKFVVRLPNGETCESNVKGNFDYLREVWNNRDLYIGTMATIKFFGFTPAGSLRFPHIIKLDRSNYE